MDTQPKRPARPRSSLFMYAVVLFSAAFVIVLLSYISQERSRYGQELAVEAAAVQSARQRLDQLYSENEALTARVAELEAQLAELLEAPSP